MKDLFYSSGKLLISAEYLVLNGAKALAIPTKFGQIMEVETRAGSGNIYWTARNADGAIWLNVSFILQDSHFIIVNVGSLEVSQEVLVLKKILENALILNPEFLSDNYDYEIETKLEFPLKWGLGSSSTLIANVAKWAKVNHFDLFFSSLSGSAYDVAVAIEQNPIIYKLCNNKPEIEIVDYAPKFADEIFFVYLNNKQKSDIQTSNYLKTKAWSNAIIDEINAITYQILNCENLQEFEILIQKHEEIISKLLQTETVKHNLFSDYQGVIKSLGAWGGDFILATRKQAIDYFPSKGYKTIYSWDEMIKS